MNDTDTNSSGSKGLRRAVKHGKKKLFFAVVIAVLIILFAIIFASRGGEKSNRTESYKDVTGTAGLQATIDYDCTSHCDQKFDFNVYIYGEDGHQIAVVRPDKEGKVNLALQEGGYVMLIGKKLGRGEVFPQEPLALKNGKMLELKLDYK